MYRFEDFTLDLASGTLHKAGNLVSLEPQVFELLVLFLRSEGRLLTRDDLLETAWKGRVVSDSAIASRIKRLRQALDDDGRQQRLVQTVPKRGFRFVGQVRKVDSEQNLVLRPESEEQTQNQHGFFDTSRPALAVLPFSGVSDDPQSSLIASAIHSDLITELARLRWLVVVARGSVGTFTSFETKPEEVRATLGSRYCMNSELSLTCHAIRLSAELMDLRTGAVMWSEQFEEANDDFKSLRRRVTETVLRIAELEIPRYEAHRAALTDPEKLSTWELYHMGLQRLNRNGRQDLLAARDCFEKALAHEQGFARLNAALSATHFQIAFQGLATNTQRDAKLAREFAERALSLDESDPYVNFVMGRVHWLESDLISSQGWLERATLISPSSARSHYAYAWSETILGNFDSSEKRVDLALEISPLDPLRYGMLGVRAFNYLGQGDFEQGARWSSRAASTPGAHSLIALIAVAAHQLAGETDAAQRFARLAKRRHADVSRQLFFQAFPFEDFRLRTLIDESLAKIGF
ncbi:MAG: winged helix-turn-helix domain-containing protein [Pseudomonadota bacterium]